jgi:hypothetical protein
MAKIYTGIGSRQTPAEVLALMTRIAQALDAAGYILRSGGAAGADTAFAQGATHREIFLPWPNFNSVRDGIVVHGTAWAQAEAVARTIHPAWNRLSQGAARLHTRNIFQVLGAGLDQPAQFVIFWAPEQAGEVQGGTRTAVALARQRGIPCFNLAEPAARARLERFVTGR